MTSAGQHEEPWRNDKASQVAGFWPRWPAWRRGLGSMLALHGDLGVPADSGGQAGE